MYKALLYGLLASLFFSFTFILNRKLSIDSSNAWWSAALRFVFMLPMLFLVLTKSKRTMVYRQIKHQPKQWIIWSSIGFGVFYLPIALSSNYGEAWFIAGSWQITIIAGILLTPLFGNKIPLKNLFFSSIILIGVALLQLDHIQKFIDTGQYRQALAPFILVLIAAFAYPLGNRKMMQNINDLSTTQRVFGMTISSMPFWLVVMFIALINSGLPSYSQLLNSFFIALFSGVIATILFFKATELVKHNSKNLAAIEATQAGEVLFSLLGGMLYLGDKITSLSSYIAVLTIIVGIILASLCSSQKS